MNKLSGLLSLIILFLSATVGATTEDIHLAAETGNLDSIKVLLRNDPLLMEAVDDGGYTPLHEAAYAGHADVVRYLLGLGADADAASNSGSTPLHGAAYYGHLAAVESLIEGGANVNISNSGGYTPLLSAMAGGHTAIVLRLLRAGADSDVTTSEGQTLLMRAATSGSVELTELLLARNPDLEAVDSYGRTALLLTARESGNADIARLLLDAGANMNAIDNFGSTPLELAAWRGFAGIVNLLLDRGVELPTDLERLNRLLTYSTEKALPRLFSEVVARGASTSRNNPDDGTYLHSAATGGNTEIVRGLLDQGLAINERDKYGWTPLHCAASRGRLNVARLLLEEGADFNLSSIAGYTPLSIARDRGHTDMVDLLLQQGAEESVDDFATLDGPYFGQTPPGNTPVWFAPDIVSSQRFEHSNVAFSPDGTEAFWSSSFYLDDSGYTYSRMMTSRIENGHWTKPAMASFSGIRSGDDAPFFSPDGSQLFFVSWRSIDDSGQRDSFRLWTTERTDTGWSEPQVASAELNEIGDRAYRSMASSGNVYAAGQGNDYRRSSDIFISRFQDGAHLSPVNAGGQVNSPFDEHACVAPDESYMIIKRMGHPDGFGDADLFVSFRDDDDNWTTPLILPQPINSPARDWYPSITLDGKYLIFNSHRGGGSDYYWVSTDAITPMRERALRLCHATRPVGTGVAFRKSGQVFEPQRTNSIGLGDLDRDGDLDMVCSNMHDNSSRVWLNDGNGTFAVTDQLLTEEGHGVAVEDVNSDGDLDIFMTCADENHKSRLYLNDGSARFEDSGVELGDSLISGNRIEMHDIDNDGDLDAIIMYYQEDDKVFLNDGHGQFTEATTPIPENATWGDLDRDGDIDILAREVGVGFRTHLNDGHGAFAVHWEKQDSTIVRGNIGLADLDGDGDLDAVVGAGGGETSRKTEVWHNDGSGSFSDSGERLQVTLWGRFAFGDLNGDGYSDAFVTNFGMPDYVWLNDGKGGLIDTGLRLGGYGATINPVLGDIDGDGDLDLLAPDFGGGSNVIWFNELK